MARNDLTAQRLRELLHYDPETGVFTRLISRQGLRAQVGDVAGSKNSHGYIGISVDGRLYRAHRLAWLFMRGGWPTGDIDHIDGDRANNRFDNLRDVSTSVNMQNQRRAQPRNASGYLGVTRHGNRFEASIKLDGVNRYIGSYATPEEAHASYMAEKRRLHPGCTI